MALIREVIAGFRHFGVWRVGNVHFEAICGHVFHKNRIEPKDRYQRDCPDCNFKLTSSERAY